MIYRTINIIHLSAERSSAAADLIASAPEALHAQGWESDRDAPFRLRRVLRRIPSVEPSIVEWWEGAPGRGEFDMWEANADLVVRDEGPPSSGFRRFENNETYHGVGFVCIRPLEPEVNAARRLAATGLPPEWTFLVLTGPGESVANAHSAYKAIGPVAPGQFHFRPHRSGEEPASVAYHALLARRSERNRRKTSAVSVSDEAMAEGRALWTWLAPRLRVAAPG